MTGYIPSDLPSSMQEALRSVWEAIDDLNTSDIDLKHSRRIVNALPAVSPDDVVTLQQLGKQGSSAGTLVDHDHRTEGEGGALPWRPFTLILASTASKTSDTTLADVTGMALPIGVGETWVFLMCLWGDSAATPDIKYQINVPSGATGEWAAIHEDPSLSGGAWSAYGAPIALPTSSEHATILMGSVVNGANAGNVQLQHAQNTSGGTATTVRAGSFVIGMRIV